MVGVAAAIPTRAEHPQIGQVGLVQARDWADDQADTDPNYEQDRHHDLACPEQDD